MSRYAVGLLALVMVGCSEGAPTSPSEPLPAHGEREVTVLTQGLHNPAISMMQEDFGALCERTSRENISPGRFSAEPSIFREVWQCAW